MLFRLSVSCENAKFALYSTKQHAFFVCVASIRCSACVCVCAKNPDADNKANSEGGQACMDGRGSEGKGTQTLCNHTVFILSMVKNAHVATRHRD